MLSLFTTEQVTITRTQTVFDDLNEPVSEETVDEVVEVLVCPGSTSELGVERPNGVIVEYTLHFPKTYTASLKDCIITIRENDYKVIGDPKPYTNANTPGAWNREVEVSRVDG